MSEHYGDKEFLNEKVLDNVKNELTIIQEPILNNYLSCALDSFPNGKINAYKHYSQVNGQRLPDGT